MSSLLCMNIRGVRSFASDTEQRIEFFKPLTVIVGPNGCGKTSTIECTNPSQNLPPVQTFLLTPCFLLFFPPFDPPLPSSLPSHPTSTPPPYPVTAQASATPPPVLSPPVPNPAVPLSTTPKSKEKRKSKPRSNCSLKQPINPNGTWPYETCN